MPRRRPDTDMVKAAARGCGVTAADARRMVDSYFGAFLSVVRKLPLNTPYRIYTREAFTGFVRVLQIPSVGRIGTVYSRYLRWRSNEAAELAAGGGLQAMGPRGARENAAAEGTAGGGPPFSVAGTRIWVIGADGRRLARQAQRIRYRKRRLKSICDVQDKGDKAAVHRSGDDGGDIQG